MEYNDKQIIYDKIMKKIEKSKEIENENNIKLTELKNWKEKLEKIAHDMYNIQEFKDINLLQKKKNEKEEKAKKLISSYNILLNAKKVDAKKYDKII